MSTVISVENISKLYRLGEIGTGSLAHDVNRWWHRVRGKEDPYLKIGESNDRTSSGSSDYVWSLRDVSFKVEQGEVLGIIGRNGAGKSTLLKILSRVTKQTSGRIRVKGRIASLLEVGTGFHPELTGRENIFLNGAILGMRKHEIQRKFDEIVDFSGCERYIDTPVKRYSSGMYVRLAFAVAAHLEPEILIVDEVLAVGDIQFQKKCLGKMKDVSSKEGRTILFVSHNMGAVAQLTTRCLFLENGIVRYDGNTKIAIDKYSNVNHDNKSTYFDVENNARSYLANQKARIQKFFFDRDSPHFYVGEDFSFIIRVKANVDLEHLRFSFTIFSSDGTPVGSVFSSDHFTMQLNEEVEFLLTLPSPCLAPGSYYCGVGIGKGNPGSGHEDYDVVLDTLYFEVFPESGEDGTMSYWTDSWGRIMFPKLKAKIIL